MSYAATPESPAQHTAAKRSAALFSVVAALGMTLLKFLTGQLTGSLAMLSEAAHSTVDLVAAGITMFSIQVSDRPADDTHNYGHGKVESLSAFIECGLMLGSCLWIVSEATHRIAFRQHLSLSFSIWPFAVLILSIVVDFTRAKRLHQTAQEHASLALEADAIHFSTDIWSSLAVLAGLTAAYIGKRWNIRGLELADPIAALIVSAIILKVIWQLGKKTVDSLLDATPADARGRHAARPVARSDRDRWRGRGESPSHTEVRCEILRRPLARTLAKPHLPTHRADHLGGNRHRRATFARSRRGRALCADGFEGGERA